MLTMMLAFVVGVSCYPIVVPVPKVEIKSVNGKYLFLRDGKPYEIKGAGCSDTNDATLKRLVAAGGNSIRTWGAGNETEELLDTAQKNGVTVQLGYWLGHVEHGFKWNDEKTLRDQRAGVRNMVRLYKDHPAVLTWALGNEMENGGNNNPGLWKEIEVLAKIVKAEDPHKRPVLTVVAEMDKNKADMIQSLCPSLDLVGINSYAGLATLPTRLKEFGFTKPFLVTEFGPKGQWEVAKTPWGVAIEPTSTEKAENYRSGYVNQIKGNVGWCLGSYVFIWGSKQEETATWFGMMLPTGENTQAVDVMTEQWSGKPPKNRSPRIESFTLSQTTASPGSVLSAKATASDPDGDPLAYEWHIKAESNDKRTGGAAERAPATVTATKGGSQDVFNAPTEPGAYRVFLFIRDGKGNAATANIPFLVK